MVVTNAMLLLYSDSVGLDHGVIWEASIST